MEENRQLFSGSQVNMCEAARLGCTLYDGEQPLFQANNLTYTKEWSAILREKIIAALALPDVGTRRSIPSTKRSKLLPLAQNCIDIWLILGGYIKKIAPPAEIESLLKEAGHDNYLDATQNKWPKVKSLMEAGSSFIENNQEWLLNDGKTMPPGFPERFSLVFAAFTRASAGFYDAKGDMPVETISKVDAMNQVYNMLVGMLDDGKTYLRRNLKKRELFTYQSLLSKVQGTSSISGVNIKVLVEGTLQPLTTAMATFMPTGFSFEADEKGIIPGRLPAGNYKITVTAPGMKSAEIAVKVKAGSVGRKKLIFAKDSQGGQEKTA